MIAESILPEFDHEFAQLRRVLERVPEGKGEFAPHEKSMPMARLAGHLAELPDWTGVTILTDEMDFAVADYTPYIMESREDLLKRFDDSLAKAREVLANASDEQLMGTWTMRQGEQVYFALPKVAVLRSFVLNHMIHHRAQLGVYLRMNDVPLPGMYGPSADDPGM
ncbi:MAG: DinB family protein [Gemmatimonadota bacterium]|nr:DinB family protein [Gemmatimonadota bacterium]